MLISVITVVKNDFRNISKTLASVKSQSYKNFEHIVIDGKSEDTTTDIIKKFKNKKIILYSSKDRNLYEAINKGIQKSSGKIICLLHSGDKFYNKNVLKKIVKFFPKFNCIAGNIVFSNLKGEIVRTWISKSKLFNLNNFYEIPHTSLFIKKNFLLKIGLYSTKYKISSDMDFLIRLCNNKKKLLYYVDSFLINMAMGGLSTSRKFLLKKIFQDLKILFNYFGLFFLYIYIKKIIFKTHILKNDI